MLQQDQIDGRVNAAKSQANAVIVEQKIKALDLSAIVAKIFVKVPYVNIINILLDKEVVPELLLENCKPNLILLELKNILNDIDSQMRQRENFIKALDMVAIHDQPPIERAAKAILETINST